MGTSFSEVATPSQAGAARLRMVQTRSATTSGCALPNMAVSARNAPSSEPRVTAAGVPSRMTGQTAAALATSISSDQTCATTGSGNTVKGIHSTANHGAYRYTSCASGFMAGYSGCPVASRWAAP